MDHSQSGRVYHASHYHCHPDHRFEWTRAEFQVWANGIADRFGYTVTILPVGPIDA